MNAEVVKEIAAVAEEIRLQTSKISDIETVLEIDFTEWTRKEKNLYGDEEQEARKALREARKALREEKNSLREKERQLREKEQELSKQKTILMSSSVARTLPPSIHLPPGDMDVDYPRVVISDSIHGKHMFIFSL